jgi:hypothetical protein
MVCVVATEKINAVPNERRDAALELKQRSSLAHTAHHTPANMKKMAR